MKRKRFFIAGAFTVFLLFFLAHALAMPQKLQGDPETITMDEVLAFLETSPDTDSLDLTGVPLTNAEKKELLASYPSVSFLWTQEILGYSFSSDEEEITLPVRKVDHPDQLIEALSCLPNLKKVNMWEVDVNKGVGEQLANAFPDVFFGFTIRFNQSHVFRTDGTAFSTLSKKPGLAHSQLYHFALCPDLKALDVGHNTLRKLDFLEALPKLKILIVADCGLTDISPIACQTDLEYLELFLNNITDISPLASLTNLIDLNLCFNKITDLSPLYGMKKLRRLWLMRNIGLTTEEVDKLREQLPDCDIVVRSYGSTGNIMDEKGKQIPGTSWRDHPHYQTIHYIFNHREYIGWDDPIPAS